MIMKHHYLWALMATALLTAMGCSNEVSVQEQEEQTLENVTEFAPADTSNSPQPASRTTGIYLSLIHISEPTRPY